MSNFIFLDRKQWDFPDAVAVMQNVADDMVRFLGISYSEAIIRINYYFFSIDSEDFDSIMNVNDGMNCHHYDRWDHCGWHLVYFDCVGEHRKWPATEFNHGEFEPSKAVAREVPAHSFPIVLSTRAKEIYELFFQSGRCNGPEVSECVCRWSGESTATHEH